MGSFFLPKLKGYFRNSRDVNFISPREVRVGLIYAIIVYVAFGVVDWFMMPIHYKVNWVIRIFMISPAIIILFFYSYTKGFIKYTKLLLTLLIIGGQLGIIAMIWIASAEELGRYEYFVGMILVLLWAAFVFRLSIAQMIFVCVCNVVFYNLVAIFKQRLPFYDTSSIEFAYFINNNFLMLSTSVLAAIGSIQLNRFHKRIQEQNNRIEREKEALEIAMKKAEESDRLKSAFLANMSHEIRTPMNAILGFTELLSKKKLSEVKEKNYLNVIQKKGRQLEQLIKDIIDLSRIQANELSLSKTTVNLNLLIDELELSTLELLKTDNKSGTVHLTVIKGVSDRSFYIETDIIRLRQILSNLLHNAVRFTHKGEIKFGYKIPQHGFLTFYVTDTGIGISGKDQKIIFDSFRQVEEHHSKMYDGPGLGLNIVKNLVSLMGGEIRLESELGVGSSFIVKIPISVLPDSVNEMTTVITNANDEKNIWAGKHVLISEDDDHNFLVLQEFLEPTGIKVTHAINGKEAMELVNDNMFDIVLMDIKMPEVSGFEVTSIFKKKYPGLPIIVQTAYALTDDIEWLKKSGCDEIITKPIQRGKLLRVMGKYLSR